MIATYVLLIEAWRRIIISAGETLSFGEATRIWLVSNLGKYVPGKVWSIATMAVMARNSNVAPIVAAGSSVLTQLVTVAAGIGVVLICQAAMIESPATALAVASSILILLALMPVFLPRLGRWASALSGRDFALPKIRQIVVWYTVMSAVASWLLYGIAFKFFVKGILGNAAGATSSYIAVYAASYIIGFLALFAPGGAVVRESAMVTGMVRLGLSGQADALAVAIASRLWLTVTELLPGLVYLAIGKRLPPAE